MNNEKRISVIDNALPDVLFQQALNEIKREKLSATLSSVNPITDGFAYRGAGKEGFDFEIKWQSELYDLLIAETQLNVKNFYWRATAYAAGAGISWHLDQGDGRQFAFNYYCVDEWDIDWGGELQYYGKPVSTRSELNDAAIGHSSENLHLLYPRPNRLAIIYPGCAHKVCPVTNRAGDRHRFAWTGFAF